MSQPTDIEVYEALRRLDAWVVRAKWKAYDPFDGCSSPFCRVLTLDIPRLQQLWLHAVRRLPVNLRPLLGIKRATSSKAMGFFAQGSLRLYQVYGRPEDLENTKFCLRWLIEHPSPEFKGYGWGNHFWARTRGGYSSKDTPTVVWTSLIGHAFLDAYEVLRDETYLDVARGAAEFIVNELGWADHGDSICFNYRPPLGGELSDGNNGVHNANVLGAAFIARVHSFLPTPMYFDAARRAMLFTVRDQLPNGSWRYGTHPMYGWVDSYHTGYVLESLNHYARSTGDHAHDEALRRGYRFFIETFFEADGTPRYYEQKRRPIDIQCASQGIQTLVSLRDLDARSIEVAERVARWTIAHMQDSTGYFYYRKYPLITNKTPTLHWGQATMFAALALLDAYHKDGQQRAHKSPAAAVDATVA